MWGRNSRKYGFLNTKGDLLESYASDRPRVKNKNDRVCTLNKMPKTDFFYSHVWGRNSRKYGFFNTKDRFSWYLRIGPAQKLYQKLTPLLKNVRFLLGPVNFVGPLDVIAFLKIQTPFSRIPGIGATKKMHFHASASKDYVFVFFVFFYSQPVRSTKTNGGTHTHTDTLNK